MTLDIALDYGYRITTLENSGHTVYEMDHSDDLSDLVTGPNSVVESYPSLGKSIVWEPNGHQLAA